MGQDRLGDREPGRTEASRFFRVSKVSSELVWIGTRHHPNSVYNKGMRHNEPHTATKASRKGTHQANGQWIRTDKRLAIYLRDNFRCLYCCRNLHDADPTDITLDHIKCQSDGGSNDESNLVTACRSCNCARQDKPLARFAGVETRKDISRNTARKLTKYRTLAKAILSGEINHSEIGF